MIRPNELIIFDCDGVLVDSEPITMSVLAEMVPGLSAVDAYRRFRGRKIASCLAEIEADLKKKLPARFEDNLRSRCAERYKTALSSDLALRKVISGLNGRYCIATSAPRSKVKIMLEAVVLWDLFHDRIFSAYEVGVWKPDPTLFLTVADAWGVAASDCAVIEDSPTGVAAALAAGMHTLVHDPRNEAHGPEFRGAFRFDSMQQLPGLLHQWQARRCVGASALQFENESLHADIRRNL